MTTIKNNLIPLISSTVIFSLLTACGGGSDAEPSKASATINNQQPPQPHQISQQQPHKLAEKKAYKLSNASNSGLTLTSNNNSITLTYTGDTISSDRSFWHC